MNIKLTPDKDIQVQKTRVDKVPVLILKPAKRPAINMLRDDELSREAIEIFNQHFEYAVERFVRHGKER